MSRPRLISGLLLAGLILAACRGTPAVPASGTPAGTASPALSLTPLVTLPAALTVTPALTGKPAQSPQPTPSASLTPVASAVPCDPAAGFCLAAGHFLLERPIARPGTITIDPTYLYGTTQNGVRVPHHGVEFYNASGTPVLAAADGLVAFAGDDRQTVYGPYPNFYGNLVVLEHHFPGLDQTLYSLYAHLSQIDVRTGQSVRAGGQIGRVGATGEAIGSHLHFEVRLGKDDYDSSRNPVLWLKPLPDQHGDAGGAIAGRLLDAGGKFIYTRELTVQYFIDPAQPQAAVYGVETYAPEQHPVRNDDLWNENFALGDLPAGHYRISFVWGGKLYERWIEVQPGKVTTVTLMVR